MADPGPVHRFPFSLPFFLRLPLHRTTITFYLLHIAYCLFMSLLDFFRARLYNDSGDLYPERSGAGGAPVPLMKMKRLLALGMALCLFWACAAFAEELDMGPRCGGTLIICPGTEHGHSFRCWSPNGDGTHSSQCVVQGCTHKNTVKCEYVQLEVGGQVLELCPICGDVRGEGARVLPVECSLTSLNPRGWVGHPQVFVGEMDGYVFVSACYEKAGRTAPSNELRISASIPADTMQGLTLVGLGGISDKGLSCDWVGDAMVLGLRLVYREPALLVFSRQ